jgi:hypothetical protein
LPQVPPRVLAGVVDLVDRHVPAAQSGTGTDLVNGPAGVGTVARYLDLNVGPSAHARRRVPRPGYHGRRRPGTGLGVPEPEVAPESGPDLVEVDLGGVVPVVVLGEVPRERPLRRVVLARAAQRGLSSVPDDHRGRRPHEIADLLERYLDGLLPRVRCPGRVGDHAGAAVRAGRGWGLDRPRRRLIPPAVVIRQQTGITRGCRGVIDPAGVAVVHGHATERVVGHVHGVPVRKGEGLHILGRRVVIQRDRVERPRDDLLLVGPVLADATCPRRRCRSSRPGLDWTKSSGTPAGPAGRPG